MAKDLINLSLQHIAPSSIRDDKTVSAAMKAIDPELNSVSHDICEAFILSRIDELPEILIDLLAWQWHVDYYEPDLPLATKRSLVKSSISWHRIKGTPQAVVQLVTQLFGNAKVSEWFDYQGRAYFFRVAVSVGGLNTLEMDAAALAKLRRVIKCAQNARSWLEFISLIYDLEDTQLTREELAALKLATGYYDYYPYKLNCGARRWLDYDCFNGSLTFQGDSRACFAGDNMQLSFDGLHNFTGEHVDARTFNGSLDFGDLSLLPSFGTYRDLINIDGLWLTMRLNNFADDYSQELVKLRHNGLLSFDGAINYMAGLSLNGSLDFTGKAAEGLTALTLPREAKFVIGLKSVLTDTEQVSELSKLTLRDLLEDFYLCGADSLSRLDGSLSFGGELIHDARLELNGNTKFNNGFTAQGEFAAQNLRGHDSLIMQAKSILRDDYSHELVSAEFGRAVSFDGQRKFDGRHDLQGLSLNGMISFPHACEFFDGSAAYNAELEHQDAESYKIFVVTPRDLKQQLSAKLDCQDTEQVSEREFAGSVTLSSSFTGNTMTDGSHTFGVTSLDINADWQITRVDLTGGFSMSGECSFQHDGSPLIAAA
ncbi:MAG: phage tail protein I [Synergistaceae bacterium]|nr:phage tail protein I [Synergistaceae bacterium]